MAFNYSPKIVTDGLVMYLDAANTKSYVSGSTAWNDISRSGINGTLTNGPTFNTGSGGSIVFDGIDDFANLGNSDILTPKFTTFSLWVRFNTFANRPHFGKGEGGFGWVYMVVETSGLFKTFYTLASSWAFINGPSLSINTWYNLTYTYNGSLSTVYVNGVASAPVSGVGELKSTYTTNPFYLGRILSTVNFTGRLSNVTIYNRALTAQEVLQNYNATKGRYGL